MGKREVYFLWTYVFEGMRAFPCSGYIVRCWRYFEGVKRIGSLQNRAIFKFKFNRCIGRTHRIEVGNYLRFDDKVGGGIGIRKSISATKIVSNSKCCVCCLGGGASAAEARGFGLGPHVV